MKKEEKNIIKDRLKNATAGRQPSWALFEDGTYDIDMFHRTFLELEDPTEYQAAIVLVGSWHEWDRLKRESSLFNSFVQEWKAELNVKLASDATQKVIQLLRSADPSKALSAAKFLAGEEWEYKRGKGRPDTKSKKQRERELADANNETKAERERIFKVIGGGKE